jgi:Skp family chaperone for outer membrane proteins
MNSKIVRIVMATVLVFPVTALAQAGNTGAAAAPPAPAAPAPSTATSTAKVGIILLNNALVGTNEGQKEFGDLQKKFEPKQTELKNLSDEIDGLKKQLDTQGSKMNEDARSSLIRQIESKQKTLTRNREDAQNDYVSQQNELASKLLQKMVPVIDKYAKDNGFGLIIDASKQWPDGPVLWATPGVDITKAIVDIYNQQSGVPAAPSAARPGGTHPAAAATRPATTPPANKPPTPK